MADERNMSMEYWWNDTDRMKQVLWQKPVLPELRHSP